MTTLTTIDLPERLTKQLQATGISQQQLQSIITGFIQNYLHQRQPIDQRSMSLPATDSSRMATELLAEPLSEDIANDLDQLAYLENDDLWLAAQAQLTVDEREQMQSLLDRRQQRDGLNNEEQEIAQQLSNRYNRTMLVRAKAAALLKERGYNISGLKQRPVVE